MPEKEEVQDEPPVEAIEINPNEAVVIMLMVFLQLVNYMNIEKCSC